MPWIEAINTYESNNGLTFEVGQDWLQVQQNMNEWERILGIEIHDGLDSGERLAQIYETARQRRREGAEFRNIYERSRPLRRAYRHAHEEREARLHRLDELRTALTGAEDNGLFLFGRRATNEVGSPSAAQLVDTGFFNPDETFSIHFISALARLGFNMGAAWQGESTDAMHVEYLP